MIVLSLFDGMSCGRLALDKAGINVDKYYASEIDKYSIKVTNINYPDTIQLGNVEEWKSWDVDWASVDLLLAGFPCQAWSSAGKGRGTDDPRGALALLLSDIFEHAKSKNPRLLFLFENVKMSKAKQEFLNNLFGVAPILINSALVSAQSRERLYWTNIPDIVQPEDAGIYLVNIIEGGELKRCSSKCRRQLVFCGAMRGRYLVNGVRQDGKMKTAGLTKQRIELRYDGKTNTLTTVQKDNFVVYLDNKDTKYLEPKNLPTNVEYRKLSPLECERLQTVPEGYTNHVSNTQRYKMLGNGWTVDVVAHVFKGLNKDD